MNRKKRDWTTQDNVSIAASAELAKLGVTPILSDYGYKCPKSELFENRAELRRALNTIRDRAMAAIDKDDQPEAELLSEVISQILPWMDRVQGLIDAREIGESMNSEMAGESSASLAAEGQILARTDSFRSLKNMGQNPGFGLGAFVKAMVAGTQNPDIRNALSEGTDSAGGFTVPDYLMGQLIDLMRAKTAVVRAGALTVPLQTEKTTVARLASDPTAGWRLENAAVALSDPTFEAVTFTARSLAVLVKVSRELLEDSLNIESAIMNAFAGSMAVELDRVALFGSGVAPEPLGLVGQAGISTVDMGIDGAAISNYAPLLDSMLQLETANAEKPSGAIMAPRTWRTLAGLTDTTGQPLQAPKDVADIPQFNTTTVPVDQIHGTAVDASSVVVGDFSQLLIGVRTSLRIEVLRELFAENLQYGFVAHLRADVQLAQPGSFSVIDGIIP